MIRRESLGGTTEFILVVFFIFAILFANTAQDTSSGLICFIWRELRAALFSPETQWMVFLCLLIYFLAFLLVSSSGAAHLFKITDPNLWLVSTLLIGAIIYMRDSPSTAALTFLASAVVAQAAATWAAFNVDGFNASFKRPFESSFVTVFVLLLVFASFWNVDNGKFEYRGQIRSSGPWENPNIFGLLMAAGITLIAGQIVESLRSDAAACEFETGNWKFAVDAKWILTGLRLFIIMFIARGLLHSYSRGAWLAAFCGLAYLFSKLEMENWKSEFRRPTGFSVFAFILRLKRNWFCLSAIVVSTLMLLFWSFQQTNWSPARRVFSAANNADFSCRNRILAWEGALQIAREHPWFGVGWDEPGLFYEHYYLPSKINESGAMEMNDYLMLWAMLGTPALFCFGVYICFALTERLESTKRAAEKDALKSRDWLKIPCRAGAIVLLVGFWFDGGLFQLPTAGMFWILLELGRADFK